MSSKVSHGRYSFSGSPIIPVMLFVHLSVCLFICVPGFREGCLDQLAFDSMVPLYKLKEYADLVSEENPHN